MSLMLTIFFLVFVTEFITWIGKSVLLDLAYALRERIFNRGRATRQRQLKSEILATKAELLQTSAQDQFSKWAKLRRRVDKGIAELEKLNSEIVSDKAAFSIKFSSALWISTSGLQFALGWWYGRSAVFYLPPGWFGPLTWFLALPFAPKGSVSVGVWGMACRRTIRMGERVVRNFAGSSDPSGTPEDVKKEANTL